MVYAEIELRIPPIPLSKASLQHLMASMAQPAEFGESSTLKRSSKFIGTSPKTRPSILKKQILLSFCQGT